MTWRELVGYVRALPTSSATRTALNGGRPEPTAETILLADCFDMLQNVDWHVQAANVTKRSDLPKRPKPYPRWWIRQAASRHSPERAARIADARRRKRDRERAIAQGRLA